jgi:hypothetical protein
MTGRSDFFKAQKLSEDGEQGKRGEGLLLYFRWPFI